MATKKKASRPSAPPPGNPAEASGSMLGIGITFAVAAVLLGSAVYFAYHRNPAVTADPVPVQAAQPAVQPQVAAPAQAQAPSASEGKDSAKSDASLAPDFSLVNVADGKPVTLSKLRGKVVLVDFWATWCPPCRMTIPHLMDLQKEYGGKRFTVVGISLDQQGESVVKPFYDAWKMNYPVVIDQDGSVARNYGGIRSIPTGLLIDRGGRVITGFVGYRPKDEIEGLVKKALDSKS
jgi:cytochrome c biogenesis protein CcmG/thiol:disulfide interchange protein DsbE